MLKFTKNEMKFLFSLEEARFATCHDNIPHVKPVSYIFHKDIIWIAIDYDTRAFQNIKKNPNTGIVIDQYKPGGHKAVCLQERVDIVERGEEFMRTYKLFYKKFKWVRDEPWGEKEAPFLRIIPQNKTSWGIN
ncbi:MAG: pyridoxamine 5'-phosphate oxidase family protein [Nitrosopumilus sp.]|nr:pyridoxamine 5'-phosphate oxidase family protein [Nitrosopumilus sp.]